MQQTDLKIIQWKHKHLEHSREVINANREKLEMRKGKPTKPGFALDMAEWDPNSHVSLKDAPVQHPWEVLRKRREREAAVKGGSVTTW